MGDGAKFEGHYQEIRKRIDHGNGYTEDLDGFYLSPMKTWEALRPRVLELLDHTLTHNTSADKSRVYDMGLSQGGKAALHFAIAEPQRFAAVVCCCGFLEEKFPPQGDGYPTPEQCEALRNKPVWLFHAKNDTVIDHKNSEIIYEALKKQNQEFELTEVKLTLYDDAPPGNPFGKMPEEQAIGHGSYELAFRDPKLYKWLLKWSL